MNWQPVEKPSEMAENRLIQAIIDGHFPVDSVLPAERELALQLGVTRPTLREALQRLARDGWVDIRHGLPTRVRDYWREGQLAVLISILRQPGGFGGDVVPNLLNVRLAMAPAYTRLAVERSPAALAAFMEGYLTLPDTSEDYTQADWELHHRLTVLSGNPVYTLILNGFKELYHLMGNRYFARPEARLFSASYYRGLLRLAQTGGAAEAETLARQVMAQSLDFWNSLAQGDAHVD
ncbi:MAG TPA: fatty acid metabolism transcriptional regulator FadR [Anaerolineaceae bacterium]|nr:fatty acid metabolism transcriptional regulator FadR [Anaerolineaceae bacterium]HPN51539.1 fatty acid metabolism transcriptional regulator FadR [Anaerolineaceae bacterium]